MRWKGAEQSGINGKIQKKGIDVNSTEKEHEKGQSKIKDEERCRKRWRKTKSCKRKDEEDEK